MSGQSYVIYCNQLYKTEEKTGLLKNKEIRYHHRITDQYPFALPDGSYNQGLFTEIMNATAPYFWNPHYPLLEGELWTVVKDMANKRRWGLFLCSYHPGKGSGDVLLHYALCPLENISSLTREELVSAVLRANMIKQWGALSIPARISRGSVSNYRTEALLNELAAIKTAQLIYGAVDNFDVASWMDQIWLKLQENVRISCFYAYGEYSLERFLKNKAVLPQLLLFPGDPFKELKRLNWRKSLPLRGAPGVAASMISISSPVKASSDYGIVLFPKDQAARFTALKDVPKVFRNSIQLKHNNLDHLMALEGKEEPQNSAVQEKVRYCLLHNRTNKRYPIVKDPFWIGREEKLECTVDNGAVSRKHAVISIRGDRYYIQDNSTNGTMLNGTMLSQGRAELLEPNAQIVIGNEAFSFVPE